MIARLAALLAALTLLAVPASSHAVEIGMGDQKADMFSDPQFRALGIKRARLAVSWDALRYPWQVAELDAWVNGAKAAGIEPLLAFWHSRSGNRKKLPQVSELQYEFRRLRARYPWVTNYAVWNEANHCGEPTCNRPELVAAYYRAMKRECPSCTILASELLDQPNMARWVRRFQRKLNYQPAIWGLHNYIDANRFRTTGTRTQLRVAPRSKIWFTETGGIVKRRTKVRIPLKESSAHAALALRWVFDRLVPLSPRIERVYLYHWNAATTRDSWDSAFVASNGRERPALGVLRRIISAAAARKAAASPIR